MSGWVQFPTDEDFDGVLDHLRTGEWMKGDVFTDEQGKALGDCHVHREARVLEIPFYCYRNLCRIDFFPEGHRRRGYIIGTCTDGCEEAWIQNHYSTLKMDLEDFFDEPYNEADYEDEDAAVTARMEFVNDAESCFFGGMLIPDQPTTPMKPRE